MSASTGKPPSGTAGSVRGHLISWAVCGAACARFSCVATGVYCGSADGGSGSELASASATSRRGRIALRPRGELAIAAAASRVGCAGIAFLSGIQDTIAALVKGNRTLCAWIAQAARVETLSDLRADVACINQRTSRMQGQQAEQVDGTYSSGARTDRALRKAGDRFG